MEERDSPHLDGLEPIYVLIKRGADAEVFLDWLRDSSIQGRVRLVRLEGARDVCEVHVGSPELASDVIDATLETAVPWSEHERIEREIRRSASWEVCSELAREEDVLDHLARELEAAGLVGEERTAKLLYLALTSRLLDKPVSIAVKGPSAGGKSYTLERVLELFPPEAFYELTAMSERALVYSTEPLTRRFLIIYEAAGLEGDFASYLVRSLLSEGRLRYETVEKTDTALEARVIERAGPTGLMVTTTAVRLHPENETRLLSLPVTDTPEQTRKILRAQAGEVAVLEAAHWQALQTWLAAGDYEVKIPFAPQLAELIPPVAVRLRRDFRLLLSLIRAHALLHQATRPRNEAGKTVATLEDYAAVRALVVDLISEGVGASVSATVRETVEAVGRLSTAFPDGVSLSVLRKELGNIDKSSASRRAKAAAEGGYLKNHETQKGRPARYVLGDPLPAEMEVLPTAQALRLATVGESCAVAAGAEHQPLDAVEPEERRQQRAARENGGKDPAVDRDADGYADLEYERLTKKFPDLEENEA